MKNILVVLVTCSLNIGFAQVGDWPAQTSLYTYFGTTGLNQANAANYGMIQDKTNGLTFVNSPLEIRFRIANNDKMFLSNAGDVGIGTTTPTAKLNVVGGGIEISSAAHQLDASLHISNSFGPFGRLTQINSPGLNTHALNLMGSTNAGGGTNWWAWGALATGEWALQPATSFGGNTGLFIKPNGDTGIGTTAPDAKLAVNGKIHATEVKVTATVPGPDYVFEKSYDLLSLDEVKSYIDENKHLPEVPSAKEMAKNGINLSEMNMLLLKKVEELTLYAIEQQKADADLRGLIRDLQTRIEKLQLQRK